MAYDSESDRLVLFGGIISGSGATISEVANDTWAYDLNTNTWRDMSPPVAPSPRSSHAMAYDSGSDRIILFGGAYGKGETWAYDFNRNVWENMNPVQAPVQRLGHRMAYDAASDLVVLHGGHKVLPELTYFNDTWAYNYDTNTWTNFTTNAAPASGSHNALVYDSESDRVVDFGGERNLVPSDETWAFDLESSVWTKMNPATSPPPGWGHGMAYDERADLVVLFTSGSGQTWLYDLNTDGWTRKNPAQPPPARQGHRMAYDAESNRLILFGGRSGSSTLNNDTWAYDFGANEWIAMDVSTRPSARAYHGMVYDSESDRVVLFGGSTQSLENGETWSYDTNTNRWTLRSPSSSPLPRDAFAMSYDQESDRIILFGGFTVNGPNNETWAYDANIDTWTNMGPTVAPSRRYAARMVYDSLMDRIILYGGEDGVGFLGDTWSYDYNANTWTPLTTIGAPPPRGFQSMAYDSESNLVIMFGGNGAPIRGDTWTFDAGTTTWTQVTLGTSPSARGWAGGTYDAGIDRVVIFGGNTGPTETWAFNANAGSWSRVDASPGPSERHEHMMAYDQESDRVVLFGGAWPVLLVTNPNMVRNRETWIFDGGNRTWTMVDGPEPPVASFTFSPASPTVGDPVAFDAAASNDPDGTVVRYDWDFGDGGSAVGPTVQHSFANTGTYTVGLTVTDDDGLNEAAAQQVLVVPETVPPAIAIISPSSGAILNSTSVTVTGTASDNQAIDKVELSTDGTNWVLATGTTSWSGTISLREGSNTIYARATDTSGNSATEGVVVAVQIAPAPPPPLDVVTIAFVVAAVAGVGIVGALFVLRRRKK